MKSTLEILWLKIEINIRKKNNFWSKLYKKKCKKLYSNLDNKNMTDNKLFQKTMKPFFYIFTSKASLKNEDNAILDNHELTNI